MTLSGPGSISATHILPEATPSLKRRAFNTLKWFLCCMASLQFLRYYIQSTGSWIYLPFYLAGKERTPFQYRVLPLLFLRPVTNSPAMTRFFLHHPNAVDPARGPIFLLSLLAFPPAVYFCFRLYRNTSSTRAFSFLLFPVFLCLLIWTFCMHLEQNFFYPYDLLSVGFFTAGLCFIYERRFFALFAVVAIGTLNRETTLFLVGIYAIDFVATTVPDPYASFSDRVRKLVSAFPWLKIVSLIAVWEVEKLFLAHHYAANSHVEEYSRIQENLHTLTPQNWPAIFNLCGYLLPVLFLLSPKIRPRRIGVWFLILPVWVAVMFAKGVIWETRIYGELCGFTAVAAVLYLEQYAAQRFSHGLQPVDNPGA